MKNIGKSIRKGVSIALTTALIAGLGYGLSTSRVTLKPNQGAIVRELQNVNNVMEIAPRAIENDTGSKKGFWKQPYLPFKIGSVEAYIDLDETRNVNGTFGFWTADKISGNSTDDTYVRAFNFNFDTKIENLETWAKWDPMKYNSGAISSDVLESREEGLSNIVESIYLNGMRDQNGNFEIDKDGEPEFLGLSTQINVWYNQLVARHDFLIDKLGEEGLLEDMNKEEIKEYVSNLFEKEPWQMLGPLRLQAEGQGLLRQYEKFFFADRPWYTYGMFFNNYSNETKADVMNSLYGKNPPKDMMKDENRIKDFENRLYRDYPELNKLNENIEKVIKYDSNMNLTDLIEENTDKYRAELEKLDIPENARKVVNMLKSGVMADSGEYLNELGDKICMCPQIEQEIAGGIGKTVGEYAQSQFETAVSAIQKTRLEEEMKGINEGLVKLEETLTDEHRAVSGTIMQEYLVELGKVGYKLDQIGVKGLQQTLGQYLGTKGQEFMKENEEPVNYAWMSLLKQQRTNLLEQSNKSLEELTENELAQWMHDGIYGYIISLGTTPDKVDETSLVQIVQQYAQGTQSIFQYAISDLNADVHDYKIDKNRAESEIMRNELGNYFNEHLADRKDKEMRMWDYVLEEILDGEKIDKTTEEGKEKANDIRDKYVYEFIEQEAPEYFKEFMDEFHDLPYEESLGIVISNPELKVENEELYKGGTINREYENVLRAKMDTAEE